MVKKRGGGTSFIKTIQRKEGERRRKKEKEGERRRKKEKEVKLKT